MLSLTLLPLLLKLLFAAWAASVCLHFRPSVCSVASFVFGLFNEWALGSFRLDYEYEVEYEYDFSILVFRLHIITIHTHFIP